MLLLAIPVVLAELGWVTMGLVDTLMVGSLGPEAIGAVGIGTSVFMGVCIFAMGLLLGLDTLVSQSFGAARLDDCHAWLVHGVVLSVVPDRPDYADPAAAVVGAWRVGIEPRRPRAASSISCGADVERAPSAPVCVVPALPSRHGSCPAGDVRAHCRERRQPVRQLAADLRPPRSAGPGRHRLGVGDGDRASRHGGRAARRDRQRASEGAGRVCSRRRSAWRWRGCGGSSASACRRRRRSRSKSASSPPPPRSPGGSRRRRLQRTRLPSTLPPSPSWCRSASRRLERCGSARPSAVAIPRRAARAGWTALLFGAFFMACAATTFLLVPRQLIGAFTPDRAVIDIGVSLLFIGAIFQMFDGVQGVATGVLRGLGDTRAPMLWNLAGALVHRAAARVRALFSGRLWRHRPVVGAVDRPHHLRRGAARRLVPPHRPGSPPDLHDAAGEPRHRACSSIRRRNHG